jgi:uncharacterized Zn finger protein
MINIVKLLTSEFISENTIPSNFSYGSAIYGRGGIEYILKKPDYIEAWVGGLGGTIKEGAGSRRRVTFTIQDYKLHWICTGNPKNHQIFCKHCVALALAIKSSRPVS